MLQDVPKAEIEFECEAVHVVSEAGFTARTQPTVAGGRGNVGDGRPVELISNVLGKCLDLLMEDDENSEHVRRRD